MKKVTKFVSAICILVLLTGTFFTDIPAVSAKFEKNASDNEFEAEVFFTDKTPVMKGFDAVESGNNIMPIAANRKDEACWLLDPSKGLNNAYINMTLSDGYKANGFDGSEYDVEVDYYDEGSGYLRLNYLNIYGDVSWDNTIYANDESIWKTAKFTLTDADFSNSYNGKYDLSLSITAPSEALAVSKSPMAVGVKRIKVVRKPKKTPVYMTYKIDEPGNCYKWFEKTKIIHTTLTNYMPQSVGADITFKLITDDSYLGYEKTQHFDFNPGEKKQFDFDFGELNRCGLYNYNIEVKSDDGKINTVQSNCKIAIIKTDPNGILNDYMRICSHIERYDDDVRPIGLEVLKMANFKGNRGSFGNTYQTLENNGFSWEASYDGHHTSDYYNELENNNIKHMSITNTALPWYYGYNGIPRNDAELEMCRQTIRRQLPHLLKVTDIYELLNEPNIVSFNSSYDRPELYTDYAKVAYEEIKRIKPDAKITGMGLCFVGMSTGDDYLYKALETGTWKYLDALSIHPYTSNTPEKSDSTLNIVKRYKEEFAKYGQPDKEIMFTEYGFTTTDKYNGIDNITDEFKGAWNSRAGLMYKIYNGASEICLYNFEKKGTIATAREDNFGMVSPGLKNTKKYRTHFFPENSYLVVAGYNYIMAQSTADKVIDKGISKTGDANDGNVAVYKFKSKKFNTDIITLASTNEQPNTIVMDLGINEVSVYDAYGNERKMTSDTGIYTFLSDTLPTYILGDFTKNEILHKDGNIKFSATQVENVQGDTFEVNIKNNDKKHYDIKVVVPDKAKLLNTPSFDDDGNAVIKLQNNAPEGDKYDVEVTILDNQNAVAYHKISVTSVAQVSFSFDASLADENDYNKWQGLINVRNHSVSKPLSGKFNIKKSELIGNDFSINVGYIPPGKVGQAVFELPEIKEKSQYSFETDFVDSNNNITSQINKLNFTLAIYADNKPKIDANLDEWNKQTGMYVNKPDQLVKLADWSGNWSKDDVSGYSMVMWDEDNLYIAFDVTDDVFSQTETGETIWNGDSIQFGVFYGRESYVAMGQANTTYHEIGFALTDEGPQTYRWLSQDNYYKAGPVNESELAVKVDGNHTYYEARIPWKALLNPGHEPKKGDKLGFAYLINDNDRNGRKGFIQFASGIGNTKNASLFNYIELLKR